jgi:PAS domain S-box-containing protein
VLTEDEQEMLRQAAEFEDLYNNAPCGHHSLDPHGLIIRMNNTELSWLGYTREEVVGKMRFSEIITAQSLNDYRANFSIFKQRGWINNTELELVRKDGSTFPVLLNATAVSDAAGNYLMSRSTLFDISERKRMEEELRRTRKRLELRVAERTREIIGANAALRSEIAERKKAEEEISAAAERYRIVFYSNPLPMYIYDAESLEILEVNEAATEHYGYTRDEFLKLTIKEIRSAEELPALMEAMAKSPVERTRLRLMRHRKKNGELMEIELFSHDLIFADRQARLVIANDVTDKRRIEANQLRSQRLESLGTLAGGIAHDLNNILSPISISVYLLRSKITDEHGLTILDTLEEVTERGSQLVKQVLSFARGMEGERSPINPKLVLREVVGILKETFPKTIKIQFSAADSLSSVVANPTQLHQILMNLCVNARDAMPRGGVLEIAVEDIRLDEHYAQMLANAEPGHFVMITVRDTGSGIRPQIIDKIFDPFFTTKEQGKGTGLGLSTSLGIVRSHGGFINVYSEPKVGTQFKVYLPALATNSAADVDEEQPEPPSGNGELILVVDDEESIRRTTRSMLEAFGYRVMTASNGIEARSIYLEKKDEIRAVLTDMVMPEMDGAVMIGELRGFDPELPIIASSGLTEVGKEEQARKLGAQKFLPKPYTAVQLLWALNEIL